MGTRTVTVIGFAMFSTTLLDFILCLVAALESKEYRSYVYYFLALAFSGVAGVLLLSQGYVNAASALIVGQSMISLVAYLHMARFRIRK